MPTVDLLLYDFGALSVSYTIPLRGSFGDLLTLSESLYDNATLLADSRQAAEDTRAEEADLVVAATEHVEAAVEESDETVPV